MGRAPTAAARDEEEGLGMEATTWPEKDGAWRRVAPERRRVRTETLETGSGRCYHCFPAVPTLALLLCEGDRLKERNREGRPRSSERPV
jgi:hypothetical protein